MVADRYRDSPTEVIHFGLENLKRWQRAGVDCDDFQAWEGILRHHPETLPEILCSLHEDAVRLRQSSPFAGLIPQDSRMEIFAATE